MGRKLEVKTIEDSPDQFGCPKFKGLCFKCRLPLKECPNHAGSKVLKGIPKDTWPAWAKEGNNKS